MNISKHIHIKAWFLLGVFLSDMLIPLGAWALTSGPSQPEVHSFEPVTTNQMVDLFSGDFTYNLPLLTVPGPNGGYPVNIAYHSGIGMEQEASWVGLGWNISPGVINRDMRGLPDDFKNARVNKKKYTKTNRTYSIGADAFAGVEALGIDHDIGIGMSVMYNNYKGVGIGANFSTTSSAALGGLGIGLSNNLNFDPYSGLGYSPSISVSKSFRNSKRTVSGSFGVQFSALEGYQGFTTGVNHSKVTHELRGGAIKYKTEPGRRSQKTLKKSLKRMFREKSTSRTLQSSQGANVNVRAASTFSPSTEFPTKSKTYTISVKPGGVAGVFAKPKFDVTYSHNKFYRYSETYDAYGFMNLEHSDGESLIDFNREERSVTKNTRYLPFPNATYDIYQVKGQGIGGVFRPFRPEKVKLHEPGYHEETGEGGSLDVEFGGGIGIHAGTDIYHTSNEIRNTVVGNHFGGQGKSNANPFYEPFYFKASGEIAQTTPIGREKRAPRTQQMSYRTIEEMENSPRYKESFYSNYSSFLGTDSNANLADQIGEISVSGPNGMKYVYGIPAYNNKHTDYTTALSSTDKVIYNQTEFANITAAHLRMDNNKGTDEFYSESTIPKYAYAYLLTSLYSQDYVDLTNNGPSEDDLGYYVHFNYNKHSSDFKWRSPYIYGAYSEANINLNTDDKGSISYGNKEIYYLESIETKTHIAKFTSADRKDGKEAYGLIVDSNDVSGSQRSKALHRIDLYSKLDLNIPIKTVHFEYDNSLCKGVYNHSDYVNGTPGSDSGKLTLKKIYFTYGNSIKGALNPYTFNYSSSNPNYAQKSMDRWGNYKPLTVDGIPSAKFPFVRQDNDTINNSYVSAWNLTDIKLPSGGEIKVKYESDDYKYVQDKPVKQMMRVTDIDYDSGKVFFKYNPGQIQDTTINAYFNGITDVYFKVYNKLKKFPTSHPNKTGTNTTGYDYVEGYATLDHSRPIAIESATTHIASFYVKKVKLKKHKVTPFQQAAIHRLKLDRFDVLTNPPMSDNGSYSLIDGIMFSVEFFGQQFESLISGYLNFAYNKKFGYGGDFSNQNYPSYVRLNCPNSLKYGGGSRVKQVEVHDHWNTFTSGNESGNHYGKQYIYKLEDGSSSGVAENEPVFGDEESALRIPVRSNQNDVYLHDEIMSDHLPASSIMPGAGVGYSRVIERSIYEGVNNETGSGQIVSEFYTAKDYPIISQASTKSKQTSGPKTFSLGKLGSEHKNIQSYGQHYTIVKNDMHGKAKRVIKYKSGDVLFTEGSTAYADIPFYERMTYHYHNQNKVPVLTGYKKGGLKELGVTKEQYSDNKIFTSYTEGFGGQINVDGVPPIIIPTAFPRKDVTNIKFSTQVSSDIVSRNAIPDKVVLESDGSYSVTQNDAFDPRTGVPLRTSTFNEFGDQITEFFIPGHWYYPTMRNGSVNDRAELFGWSNYSLQADTMNITGINDTTNIFTVGDLVEVQTSGGVKALWVNRIVEDAGSFTIKLGNSNGTSISGISGDIDVMVVQSANKNLTNVNAGYLEFMADRTLPILSSMNVGVPTLPNTITDVLDGNYPDLDTLEIATGLNNYKTPHDICGGDGIDPSKAFTFFNIDSAYFAGDTVQAIIDELTIENSITFFDCPDVDILDDFSSVATQRYDFACSAHLLFPDTFVTDFKAHGGAWDDVFGSILNYSFTYIEEGKVRMRIDDPSLPDDYEYEYFCEWVDPIGCFDLCIMPLNTSATVFEEDWADEYTGLSDLEGENGVFLSDTNINPFRYGIKGVWRPKRDYVFQIARTQAGTAGQQTDLRNDGIYDDFTKFDWESPDDNPTWTWTNEMTKYSPYGFNLETRNALNIHSANLIGYEHSLVLASAQNARHFEIGCENFEEKPSGSAYVQGSGNLVFTPISGSLTMENEGHTGNRALRGTAQISLPVVTSPSSFEDQESIAVQRSKEYVLSFWAKDGTNGTQTTSFGTRVEVKQGSSILTNENTCQVSVDGWKKYEYIFKPLNTTQVSIQFLSDNGGTVVIDDVRLHPFNSNMVTYVYDPVNYRYLAGLDDQNMATLYAYDQEGKLTLVKKETTRGIQTLKSTQAYLQSQPQ